MWIGEFSQAAGLNLATVRFYVRSGLLHPRPGSVGGSRPYMEFSQKDLRTLNSIRAGQALGMSLAEIKLLASERRAGGKQRMLQAMIAQRDKLARQAADRAARRYALCFDPRWRQPLARIRMKSSRIRPRALSTVPVRERRYRLTTSPVLG